MEKTMKISSSPHIRDKETTTNIMGQVIVALMPATFFGVYNFGVRALITIFITVISCVIFEAGYQKLLGLKVTVKDLSAALTGLLLALNLPPEVPFWLPVLGSFFAIIVNLYCAYSNHSHYYKNKAYYVIEIHLFIIENNADNYSYKS